MPLSAREVSLLWPARSLRHSGGTFFEHLVGTYAILSCWGMPAEICKAGLCHSIYSTEFFEARVAGLDERERVRACIGAEAERLAYLFCTTRRAELHRVVGAGRRTLAPARVARHDAKGFNRLSALDLEKLIAIEAANVADQSADSDGRPCAWMHLVVGWAKACASLALPCREASLTAEQDERIVSLYREGSATLAPERAGALFDELSGMGPLCGEPFVVRAVISLEASDHLAAARLAIEGRERIVRWGTAWDKRLSQSEWMRLADAVAAMAIRKEGRLRWPALLERLGGS